MQRHYTVEDYVRFEAFANAKHEYFDGDIIAMAGGTLEHSAIAANVMLRQPQLRAR